MAFIIAEAGINHRGSVDEAKRLVEAAADCGCDAIKFQTYTTEKRVQKDSPIFGLLKSCELSYDQQLDIKIHADRVGIRFMSTPFDVEALSFLVDRLGVRVVKLASFDLTNHKFLREVNSYGSVLPAFGVILSTGMGNAKQIEQALGSLSNIQNLSLLHCVSAYPTPDNRVNLRAIETLKHLFSSRAKIGYSDHTSDILAPSLAVIAGARVIEKHFTLDLNNGAVDNPVSADPQMMKQLVDVVRLHETMLGDGSLKLEDIEQEAEQFRRFS